MAHLIRLSTAGALKERRLAALLAGRTPDDVALPAAIEDAQLLGSLQLAGFDFSWDQVLAARRGETAPEPILALRRARAAVDTRSPLDLAALLAWHAAVSGRRAALRTSEHDREGAAPPAFIEGRLRILEQWLGADSARELGPAQAGALALARVVEIAPFEDGNGRVSRLAASHMMVRAGARPPILVGADQPRLEAALQSAFRLETVPLAELLQEASERALDVMIQTLERA